MCSARLGLLFVPPDVVLELSRGVVGREACVEEAGCALDAAAAAAARLVASWAWMASRAKAPSSSSSSLELEVVALLEECFVVEGVSGDSLERASSWARRSSSCLRDMVVDWQSVHWVLCRRNSPDADTETGVARSREGRRRERCSLGEAHAPPPSSTLNSNWRSVNSVRLSPARRSSGLQNITHVRDMDEDSQHRKVI